MASPPGSNPSADVYKKAKQRLAQFPDPLVPGGDGASTLPLSAPSDARPAPGSPLGTPLALPAREARARPQDKPSSGSETARSATSSIPPTGGSPPPADRPSAGDRQAKSGRAQRPSQGLGGKRHARNPSAFSIASVTSSQLWKRGRFKEEFGGAQEANADGAGAGGAGDGHGGDPEKGDDPGAPEKDALTSGSGGDRPWGERTLAYQYAPFRGMYHDVKRRLPLYCSDWTIAFHPRNLYRVSAATIRMYFNNLMPAIAYLLDMNDRTGGHYGMNEVLLASALPLIVFSIFSVQPLTIVGVTGLINLVNYTNYDIVVKHYNVNYLQFQAWMLIWAAILHFLTAVFNICDYSRYITDMTSTTFGAYVGVIYIQKGVELLILEFGHSSTDGWLSCLVALLFAFGVYWVEKAGGKAFGPLWMRKLLVDYGFVMGIIFFTGFVHIPGELKSADLTKVPITRAFYPSTDRDWVVDFWNLEVKWIFVALPFGFLLTLLFYFDGNVSSLMAQARHFPVKRPAGFHWDFFLLGITTLISGILGLPAPNPLVPQAPTHTESLSVMGVVRVSVKDVDGVVDEEVAKLDKVERKKSGGGAEVCKVIRTRVVEQRLSHLAMGLLTIGTMTRPLLVVLGLMPRAMFAGVFIVVGWASVESNPILHKTLYLLRDPRMTPADHPLNEVSKARIAKFVGIQWLVFAATVAISQTIAAIGFPVLIIALIPVRWYYGPKWFTPRELRILDAPTANAPGVLSSIGGDLPRVTGEGLEVAPDTGIEGSLAVQRREQAAEARTLDEEGGEGLRRR